MPPQTTIEQRGRCARMDLRIERTERAIRNLQKFAEKLEQRGLDDSMPRQRLRHAEALLGELRASQWRLIRAAAGGR
jgi:hypothetical protein